MFNQRLKAAIHGCVLANGRMTAEDLRRELKIRLRKRYYVALGQMIRQENLLFVDDDHKRILVVVEDN